MWVRLGLAALSLVLLRVAEQVWHEHARATSTDFGSHPDLLLAAFGLQLLAGASAGLAVRGTFSTAGYRTSHAVAVGVLPILLILVLFAFEFGVLPSGTAFGQVVEFSSRIGRTLGILVGLGLVAGLEPD